MWALKERENSEMTKSSGLITLKDGGTATE
jgi:hypothetical protein